jgi:CIC family chloride channel protein
LIVAFLVQRYAPEAKGHGVPEVMEAVLTKKGVIRPIVSLIKIFATAVDIGSGGSTGREGPIVQIGASFGSTFGQWLKLKPGDRILLIAAGAAGGIAGTFNAPIAGVLFSVELIIPGISVENFIPLIISSTIATYIARIFLGVRPAFLVPAYNVVSVWEFLLYFILGIISGFVAILFTDTLAKTEIIFDKVKMSKYVKPAIGGLIVGTLSFVFFKFYGRYFLFGVGYSFISDVLSDKNFPFIVLFLLVFAKIIATSFTLGSGGSGGILAPSLFVGAAAGGAFGIVVHTLFPAVTANPAAYALIGMAAVVSGTTGATLTAIVMSYELTRSYSVILPLMLATVTSSFVVNFLYQRTMYTEPLMRRGILFHGRRELDLFAMISIKEAMLDSPVFVFDDDTIVRAREVARQHGIAKIPVVSRDMKPIGIVRCVDIASAKDNELVKKYLLKMNISVRKDQMVVEALKRMEKENSDVVLVVNKEGKLIGVLPAGTLRSTYLERRKGLL